MSPAPASAGVCKRLDFCQPVLCARRTKLPTHSRIYIYIQEIISNLWIFRNKQQTLMTFSFILGRLLWCISSLKKLLIDKKKEKEKKEKSGCQFWFHFHLVRGEDWKEEKKKIFVNAYGRRRKLRVCGYWQLGYKGKKIHGRRVKIMVWWGNQEEEKEEVKEEEKEEWEKREIEKERKEDGEYRSDWEGNSGRVGGKVGWTIRSSVRLSRWSRVRGGLASSLSLEREAYG